MSTSLDFSRIRLHLAPPPTTPPPQKNEDEITFLTQFRLDRSLNQIGNGSMILKM